MRYIYNLVLIILIYNIIDINCEEIDINESDDRAYLALDYFSEGPGGELGRDRSKRVITYDDAHINLYEADEYDYYGRRPQVPQRFTNITSEEFLYYLERGIPIIVTDVTRDWPMKGWTCESIKNRYAKEKFRQEYTGEMDQRNRDKLGSTNFDNSVPINNGPTEAGPNFAPFYWDVKDRRGKRIKSQIKANTRLPYFMRSMYMAAPTVNDSAEFWFSRSEAGAKAHIDQHCESTMSIQLSGEKQWRLSLQPKIDNILLIKRFFDGDTDTNLWRPLYDFTLKEGEGLFFPPGMIHETKNVGNKCAVSVTYQYFEPVPAIYIREWLPRLIMGSALSECSSRWSSFVSFAPNVRTSKSIKEATKRAKNVFKKFDTNNNNYLEVSEVLRLFKRWNNDQLSGLISADMDARPLRNHRKEVLQTLSKTSVKYYDKNNDGKISKDEFLNGIQQWTSVVLHRKRGEQLVRKWRKKKRQSKWCKSKQKKKVQELVLKSIHDNSALEEIKKMSIDCQRLSKTFQNILNDGYVTEKTISKQNQHDEL